MCWWGRNKGIKNKYEEVSDWDRAGGVADLKGVILPYGFYQLRRSWWIIEERNPDHGVRYLPNATRAERGKP